MKKIYLLIIALVLSISIFAQSKKLSANFEKSFDIIKLKTDSETINCYRLKEDILQNFNDRVDQELLMNVFLFQSSYLNKFSECFKSNKNIQKEELSKAYNYLKKLSESYPKINFGIFMLELNFYTELLNIQVVNEANSIRIQDSLQLVANKEKSKLINQKIYNSRNESTIKDSLLKITDYEKYKREKLQNHFTSITYNDPFYKYYTQFTNMDVNFVNLRVQSFLSDNKFYQTEDASTYTQLKNTYMLKSGTSKNRINVIYDIIPGSDNKMIISKCKINGFDEYVVDFFLKFWKTTIKYDFISKNKIAYYELMEDKITLTWSIERKFAEITIDKNPDFTIKDL